MITKERIAELRKDWEENGLAENPEAVDDMLATLEALWKVADAAKAFTEAWWFQPGADIGCCGLCDGNLLPLLKGRHADDCHVDLVYKALAALEDDK